MSQNNQEETSLERLLRDYIQEDIPLRAALIYRLSDVQEGDLAVVREVWESIPLERRRTLIARLAESSETNYDLDFSDVGWFALNDQDAEVRQHGIAALWVSEDTRTMRRLIDLLEQDEAPSVRAAAAEALGRFVLAGELGDLPKAATTHAENALLAALENEEIASDVYRRALESAAYATRSEISGLIEAAYDSNNVGMQATAIFAMGRSANDESWKKHVTKALSSAEAELRFEAARAAGELGLTSAVSSLIRLTGDSDREVKEAAIWSLGEIGGQEAQRALMAMADQESDEAIVEVIEDALNTAALASGEISPYLFLSEANDEDFDGYEDDEE